MKGKVHFIDGTDTNLKNDKSIDENIEKWHEDILESKRSGKFIELSYSDCKVILNVDSIKYVEFRDEPKADE